MYATRFGTGLTYEAFKASMTQNRERLDSAESAVVIDSRDLEFFGSDVLPLMKQAGLRH